jgi:hypothetical protein
MDAISITVNGRQHSLEVPRETPVATARPHDYGHCRSAREKFHAHGLGH